MAILGEWIRRLAYLVRRRALEEELQREMEAHRAMLREPAAFGNTLRLREEARDAWGWRWLDDLRQDVRFAGRTLRHSPGFTLTAMLTLAIGIGVNIGMFRLVNGLLLRPLYDGSAHVVSVHHRPTTPGGGGRPLSYPNYLDLQEGTADLFAHLAAFTTTIVGLDVGEGPRRTLASEVTANYFHMFGTPLSAGRAFTAEDGRAGPGGRVAILSHSLWQRRGADRNMIGRSVRINGDPVVVVGVAAEGFTGTAIPGPDVWLPLDVRNTFGTEAMPAGRSRDPRDRHYLGVVGRVRAGMSPDAVDAALATVARRLGDAFPAVNEGYTFETSAPGRLMFMPGAGGVAMTAALSGLLMLMPAIVLLVACLNLADLLLARGHMRRQELAIRSSLGAGRGRITRQLLTEGLLLSLAGGVAGLVLSAWAAAVLVASLRPVLPLQLTLPDLGLDWRVLAGTVAFSVGASFVLGAWPAWALSGRAAIIDLKRHGGEDSRQPGGIRIGNVLVVAQVALSLLLLASGGLFLMSAVSAATADPGFRLEGGVLAEIDPDLAGYDEARGRRAHLALVDRLRTVPGVDAVTIGSTFPFTGFGDSRQVAPAGAASAESTFVDSVFTVVGREYAYVLGLPILAGRDFTDLELLPGVSGRWRSSTTRSHSGSGRATARSAG